MVVGTGNSTYYFGPFDFDFDLGNASLPQNQGYTTTLESGTTVHFNVCAGTSLCDGNIACIVKNGVVLSYGTATEAGYYASDNLYPTNTNVVTMSFYTATGDQNTVLNVTCDPTIPPPNNQYFRVLGATLSNGRLTINASSLYACPINYNFAYVSPTYYSSFTAPIFMKGRIPYFLQDVLTSSSTEFLGTLYYSTQYGLVINGTLTNTTSGSSHFVAFYYVKEIPFNPPSIFNYVVHQGSSSAGCYLLGNPDSDYAEDIFSSNYNDNLGLEREYTPIYFNKGPSFAVRSYSNTDYANHVVVTLMQRVSDGLPIFIGDPLLSPWAQYDQVGSYVSELNWNNIQSTTLGPNTFQPPSSLGCILA